MGQARQQLNVILPVGTHVIVRDGVIRLDGTPLEPESVGVIAGVPTESTGQYDIRLPDGAVVAAFRSHLTIRKRFQYEVVLGDDQTPDAAALWNHVILRCVVGSQAYGLAESGSDVDLRGIYLPPATRQWSLAGVPDQLENDETQEVYWELQKFLMMALKANPNILECLYSPDVRYASPIADELLVMRECFLSRFVYQTYNGYVLSQFLKLEQDLRTRGEIRWKHAMHLIRLLLNGITILREGVVPLSVEEWREQLLAIRRAEMPWDEVDAWRLELHRQLDVAFASTCLPDRPDYVRANEFLVRARRAMVDAE